MARYCASDWHGNSSIAKQILDYLKPDDELYFLGDAIDRGADGWQILKMLLSDPRIIFIKGNHENIMQTYYRENSQKYLTHWLDNGGDSTLDAVERDSKDNLREILHKVEELPTRIDLDTEKGHLILTHAGCWPDITDLNLPQNFVEEKYIWDRRHIWGEKWDNRYPDTYVIHGHTPVEIFAMPNDEKNFIPTVQFYCENHKIDIDMGTFYTGIAALLNLDTFEVKYFKE